MNSIGQLVLGFSMLLASSLVAAHPIQIVKAEGGVTVSNASGNRGKPVSTQSVLPQANILSTGPNGRAVVKVGNTGFIVLDKNSQVEINQSNQRAGFFRQISGMVYYAVNTIKGQDRTLEVRTKTATMGIRGTRFLVADTPDRREVGMRKGTLTIVSPNADFEIHKRAEQDEFEAMRREGEQAIAREQAEFQAYQANTEREFIEYKKEFSLGADRMVSFDGNRVDDRPLSGETRQSLESLENYGAEWVNQVQD
jgi:hypothetical protein